LNGDEPRLVYLGLFLILLVASLGARRLPIKDTLKMALAWVAIFGTLFVLFTFRGDFARVWQHVKDDVAGTSSNADGTVKIKMGEDGHFHANVALNAVDVRMMIDTGATSTVVSQSTARNAGIEIGQAKFPVLVDTANGTVALERAEVDQA
jgi:aspartyl protease family protein